MELALDVGVIWQLTLSLFVVCVATALSRSVVVAVCCRGLRIYASAKGGPAMRRAEAKAVEAAAAVAEAEAVVAAERLRLLPGGT